MTESKTTYEIHDHEMHVIRCEDCHEAEIVAGRIPRQRISADGTGSFGRRPRYERAIPVGGFFCDVCGTTIERSN